MSLLRRHRSKIVAALIALAAVGAFCVRQVTNGAFYANVYAWLPSGAIRHLSPSSTGLYYEPQVNPAGTQVVFFGADSGPPRLWLTDVDTGKATALTPADFAARHPAFSADGSQIVFAADEGTGQPPERVEQMGKDGVPPPDHIVHLFVMNANGDDRRQITFGAFQDQRPCFSPDGKTVVFVSNRGDGTRLWSVSVTGDTEPTALQTQGYGYRPCFSTDGQWIFFFTRMGGRDRLCRMPASGGPLQLLANDTIGDSHGPFADPAGKSLLFHSFRCGRWTIWEIPLDGSEPHRVQPPGFDFATHATRSRNGLMAFDVATNRTYLRRLAASLKRWIISLRGCE
jgi:Tol biopolymer transport system component